MANNSVSVSVIIRTLNEAQYLGDLLSAIAKQRTVNIDLETVVIDSGSTDDTIKIAEAHGAKLTFIDKRNFTFGRSLNRGCEFSTGKILVFVSGHCVPTDQFWLQNLCQPIIDGRVSYCYGGQVGDDTNNFSERRIFARYFPCKSATPQQGYFCNNANAAIRRDVWGEFKFNEKITGLEDMELAKRITLGGHLVGYVAEAKVFHHHDESWSQVRNRFYREALTMRKIDPGFHLTFPQTLKLILRSTRQDWINAFRINPNATRYSAMFKYRFNQYFGIYAGLYSKDKLTKGRVSDFYYPDTIKANELDYWLRPMLRTPKKW
ncbi:glycosyltransferase [Planktomarina temperata]|nr:glycosyltransferase [Planktomarina temperata]